MRIKTSLESNRYIFMNSFLFSDFCIFSFGKVEFFRSRHLAIYLKKVRHPSCPPYHGNIDPIELDFFSMRRRQNGLTANFQFSKNTRYRKGTFLE